MQGVVMGAKNEVNVLSIPPIEWLFTWQCHPEHLQLKALCNAWLVDRFTRCTAFDVDRIIRADFHLLAALFYANGITHRVSHIVKFVAWFFVFDDVLDDPAVMGCDLHAADQLRASVLQVLQPSCETEAIPLVECANLSAKFVMVIHVLRDTANEWWTEMMQEMPQSQQARFIETFVYYLQGTREQMIYKCAGIVPNVENFELIRHRTGGVHVSLVLTEYALGLSFEDRVHLHPLLCKLQTLTSYHACIANEMFSFKKEHIARDIIFNFVTVLHSQKISDIENNVQDPIPSKSHDRSMQATFNEVCKIIKETDENCTYLFKEIRECHLLMAMDGMESFLQGVANLIGGNIYWHLISPRYGICASDATQGQPPNFISAHHQIDLTTSTI